MVRTPESLQKQTHLADDTDPDKIELTSKSGYLTDSMTSLRMSCVRPVATGPEKVVRAVLRDLGFQPEFNLCNLPGRPDIVCSNQRKIIFVHGCFWHRHPGCSRTTVPARNRPLWQKKFDRTIARDRRNRTSLEDDGWQLLILWECTLKNRGILEYTIKSFLSS